MRNWFICDRALLLQLSSRAASTLFVACIFVMPAHAAGSDKQMTWLLNDRPPAFIIVNGLPTNGYVDSFLQMITSQWTDVNHNFIVTPIGRAFSAIKKKEEVCFPGAVISREREKIAYFTATHLQLPHQLIVRESAIKDIPLNKMGQVDLRLLMTSNELTGIINRGRSYSDQIDDLIKNKTNKAIVEEVSNYANGSNILRMLALGRGDYTFEYEQNFIYQLTKLKPLQGEKLIGLPIAELETFKVGIACPLSPWGKATIERIDEILSRVSQLPQYREAQMQWVSDKFKSRYRKDFDEFYLQRKSLTHYSDPPG
ncbi:TIGR02285 family protein [Undibacterium sp. Ji67W]|uniref:TIGR02285 family protein n=1 Tax=Undibacterium sp. Ji67W TaxID=3413042 RepID=UPI003BEF62CE